jgi:hypothetical protein
MCVHNCHRKNGFALYTPWLKTKELWCIKLQLWYNYCYTYGCEKKYIKTFDDFFYSTVLRFKKTKQIQSDSLPGIFFYISLYFQLISVIFHSLKNCFFRLIQFKFFSAVDYDLDKESKVK